MNGLLRELAPISERAWPQIENEARSTLELTLAARKLVDFEGPLGWTCSSVDLNRVTLLDEGPGEGVDACVRQVRPMVELRIPFVLPRRELEAIDRGARDPDLDAVVQAARTAAIAEDRAIFHGYGDAHIEGIVDAAPGNPLKIDDDYEEYPGVVAEAVEELRTRGIEGPYAIALGPRCYTGLNKTIGRGGELVIDQVRGMLDGPVVWAPGLDGALVLTTRGDDFRLTVGRDFSIGYTYHTADEVHLYLQESFTFVVHEAEAAVPLGYDA